MSMASFAGRARAAFLGAALAFSLAGPALAQTLYVTNAGSNTVSIIRTQEANAVDTVAVGANPQGVAVSRDGSRAYTANAGGNSVSVINTSTKSVIATIPVGVLPYSVAVSPDGRRVYSANYTSGTVSVIDAATNTRLQDVGVGDGPISLTVSPDNGILYVVNFTSETVSVLRTSDLSLLTTVAVGKSAYNVVISSDGSFAYVSNASGPSVTRIETTDHSTTTYSVSGTPHASAISPDTRYLYTLAYQVFGSVYKHDTTNKNQIGAAITVGNNPHSLAFTSDGSRLYVANYGEAASVTPGTISVINTGDDTVIDSITVGVHPSSIAVGNTVSPPTAVPTLSEWAMILLGLLLAAGAAATLQRSRQMA